MLNHLRVMLAGESYWKVRLKTRTRELSELDTISIPQQHGRWLIRRYEWLEDLIGAGDIGKVTDVMLVTPAGVAHIPVPEPYTVFQFSRGTTSLLTQEKIKNVQIVGVVVDKDTGEAECAIWDVQAQRLFTGRNNVKDFQPWRPGVAPIGRLAIETLELRGIV
jgi:hypothetical protein